MISILYDVRMPGHPKFIHKVECEYGISATNIFHVFIHEVTDMGPSSNVLFRAMAHVVSIDHKADSADSPKFCGYEQVQAEHAEIRLTAIFRDVRELQTILKFHGHILTLDVQLGPTRTFAHPRDSVQRLTL